MRHRPALVVALIIALAGTGALAAADSQAAFPGRNGAIAYEWPDPEADLAYVDFMTPRGAELWRANGVAGSEPDFSANGRRLAYGYAPPYFGIAVAVVPPPTSGRQRVLTRPPGDDGPDFNPSWAPNGRTLAFDRSVAVRPDSYETFIYSVRSNGSRLRRLARGSDPAWSVRDTIAFVQDVAPPGSRRFDGDILVMNARGGRQRTLTRGRADDSGPDWSPDGRRLVFSRGGDLVTIAAAGGPVRRLTRGRARDLQPAFSPDGRSIVFVRGDGLRIMPARGGRTRALRCPWNGCSGPDWQPLR